MYEHEQTGTGPGPWPGSAGNYPEPSPPKPLCGALPPRGEALTQEAAEYLVSRNLDPFLALSVNGWYPAEIAGVARLVIPATASDPKNRYWQARALRPDAAKRWESPHGVSRGDAVVLTWPRVWLKEVTKQPQPIVCVEGPMDALAASGEGLMALAFMGATPPEAALKFAAEIISPGHALLIMDADQPRAAVQLLEALVIAGVRCRLGTPYPWKDLAEATIKDRRRILCGD
mgnify:CR=1 FL=1